MNPIAVRTERVSRKFSLGQRHDSLRDLIPALTRERFRKPSAELDAREFWALRDVSFDIRRGESVGVIGHNGAGKSTILKHLSGVLKPTTGSISVHGRLAALIEIGAGFHQDLTGRENVFLNGVILGMRRSEIARKFDEIVAFSGLERFIDTPVKRYSSGMYARLGFSVAAHLEPDILVIDEVLSVGDATFHAKGVEKMKSVAASGATVIFVSHNLQAVADLCPRSLLLDKGMLVDDGPTSSVIQSYMSRISDSSTHDPDAPLTIEEVRVLRGEQICSTFESGEEAIIEVHLRARKSTDAIDCSLRIENDGLYEIFSTSSERLSGRPLTLQPGELQVVRFRLRLHLTQGRYFYRIEARQLGKVVSASARKPAFIIASAADATSGLANLYPSLGIGADLKSPT